MNRRKFGVLAGTSMAAAGVQSAAAQSAPADATLLTTTLTPFGAERAGNADGSIPAWTGGSVDPNSAVDILVFTDEKPILTIDASNMAQYQSLLNPGTMAMMTKSGYSIQVYPTHRTAAAPQYVYDNIARNVTTAKLNPNGGRLGFTGGYGGVPFPIIDTSDPLVGGAQLIWNHLTSWGGFCTSVPFSQTFASSAGQLVLAEGNFNRFRSPYYDPNGSLESFNGYLTQVHLYFKAPAGFNGQEVITWHTANVEANSDITWELLNGQGRVRKAPDEQYDNPNPYSNGISNFDESSAFYGNPSQYDWNYIGKQEMYIPYHCNAVNFAAPEVLFQSKFLSPDIVRWEKHRVWVVEATLHPGIRNVLSKRRFYIDEDTWFIVLGESYDGGGNMVKANNLLLRSVPALPGTIQTCSTVFNLQTGDYVCAGTFNQPPFSGKETFDIIPQSFFDPEQMSANASF
jgi:hypothetical protein